MLGEDTLDRDQSSKNLMAGSIRYKKLLQMHHDNVTMEMLLPISLNRKDLY